MYDAIEFKKQLGLLLRARVPFIFIKTTERARAMSILATLTNEINLQVSVHTLSRGSFDLKTGQSLHDDNTVVGGLSFTAQQILQKQNLNFLFTEMSDIDSDNGISRQCYDLALHCADRGACLMVIGTNAVWGQLQRLGMVVELSPPNEDEMLLILKENIEPYTREIKVEWSDEDFRTAASVLANVTKMEAENIIATLLAKGSILKSDISELSKAKERIYSDISGLERIDVRGFDSSVGGLVGLKTWLDNERPLLTADLRDRQLRPPRGVLLVGVPGCGKSLSAKAIAANWALPLFRLDLATIHGQYLGQSESRVKEALNTADRVAPCVLWIDEIEKGLAGAGGSGDGGTSTRLVGHFLFWLQESRARVFVVATANDVSRLPPELLRKGRFDEMFFVDLPDADERRHIIEIYANKNIKKPATPNLIGELIEISEGFSGADIQAAIRDVAKEAIRNGDQSITDESYRKAFRNVVSLSKTSPEQIEAIRAWGRERALPASGNAIGTQPKTGTFRRIVMV